MFRAGADARDIADLAARRQYLADGLARVVGAAALVLLSDADFAPGRHGRLVAVAANGDVTPIARAHMEHENEFNPALRRLISIVDRVAVGSVEVEMRKRLVPDGRWRRSDYFNEYLRPAYLGDPIYAALRTGAASVDGGVLVRGHRERAFDDEDCAVVDLYLRTHGALWHEASDRAVEGLPPRLRRVLELLLTGASEKQVADQAGLTAATTHQYVVEIYRRLGVSSRAQLMARLLRRS